MLNQICMYQFKEDCNDIISDLAITRLDGNDLDPNFPADKLLLEMNTKDMSGGDIFTLENYKIIFKNPS